MYDYTDTEYPAESFPTELTDTANTQFRQYVPQPQMQQKPQDRVIHLETAEEIKKDPPLEWRVKGVLPSTGVVVVYGPSRSGKSFVLLDMVARIATGTNWHGCRCYTSPVVYINLESSGGLKNRITAWEKENDWIYPQNVLFVRHDVYLINDIDALATAIPCHAVTVIDTMHQTAPNVDENTSVGMGAINEAAKKLSRLTNGLVILVHHTGKDEGRGPRGSYCIIGDNDGVLFVKGQDKEGNRTIIAEKVKEGEDGTHYNFMLKPVHIGTDNDGDAIYSCVAVQDMIERKTKKDVLDEKIQIGLDSLKAASGSSHKPVCIDDWRPQFYARYHDATQHAKKQAFQKARKALESQGFVKVVNDRYEIISPNGSNGSNGSTEPPEPMHR